MTLDFIQKYQRTGKAPWKNNDIDVQKNLEK